MKTLIALLAMLAPAVSVAETITLQWEHEGGAEGFYLYRQKGSEPFERVGTFTELEGTDEITGTGTYSWYVTAYKGSLESESSNVVTKTIVSAPTKLEFKIIIRGEVEMK